MTKSLINWQNCLKSRTPRNDVMGDTIIAKGGILAYRNSRAMIPARVRLCVCVCVCVCVFVCVSACQRGSVLPIVCGYV